MMSRKPLLIRIAAILTVVGLLGGLILIPSIVSAQSTTYKPVVDAYVRSDNPDTNYGTGVTLRVDDSPVVNSYLRFDVSGLTGQKVTKAELKIYANSASNQGLVAKGVSDDNWGEKTLTYNNAPAAGGTLSTSAAVAAGSWVTLDVTSFVTKSGMWSFNVSTPGSTAISLASRDSSSHAPQLIVTVATTAAFTPTQPAPTQTPKPSGQTITIIPSVDAYVRADNPGTNFGTGATLKVDNSPVVNSYLRFSVSGLSGQSVTQALLKIYANSASNQGLVAKSVTNTSWGETSITSNNAPAMGNTLGTSTAVTSGSWVNLDVTSYITGDGVYNFGISTAGSTAISLGARESGANAPQLIVTTSGSSSSAPTRTPTKASTSSGPTPTKAPTQPSGSCTSVILTKGPTLIYTGSNTSMRVFWQWSSNTSFTLQWGTSTSFGSSTSVSPKDTSNHLYQFDLSGLTPGTKYYYRLLTGSQCASGSFFTAPPASASSVKFFSYGDTRTNGASHNTLAGLVDAAFAADPAFQTLNLNVGDWVSGDSESAWTSEWFNPAYSNLRTQDANLSDIGVRGNHESGATYWKRYWPEPFQSGGLYWSFDYGPMHVAMLDQYTSYAAGSTQYNWLKADLAASSKPWKFVVLHEPGWSAGGGHANNTTVQNDLQPLFVQYGVAIVFGGHNHYYARASVNGVTHLTLGGGGAPSYTPASGQPNIVKTFKGFSFGEFSISGNTLSAKIISSSGTTVDSFTITK
jgi:hypothetical protein